MLCLVFLLSCYQFLKDSKDPKWHCSAMKATLIARFMGATWDPSGADRTQVGPMLAHELCYLGMVEINMLWFLTWVSMSVTCLISHMSFHVCYLFDFSHEFPCRLPVWFLTWVSMSVTCLISHMSFHVCYLFDFSHEFPCLLPVWFLTWVSMSVTCFM